MLRSVFRLSVTLVLALQVTIWGGEQKARYVFLMIGDGTGEQQVEALKRAVSEAKSEPLVLSTFPVKGWQRTRSANSEVTDSAAAATALACGVRTKNGVLGMDTEGKSLKNIAEEAAEAGMKVGILTSVSIDHATPAGFFAHVDSRGSTSDISRMLAESKFDYFGGGGMSGQKGTDPAGPDNLQLAIQNGFVVARTRDAIAALQPGKKAFAFNHRLAGGAALPWVLDNKPEDVTLAEFTAAGIRLLTQEKGFFMMVEGGKIDWACHSNDLGTAVREVQGFDQAIQVAVAFFKQHPDDTLIVATGDHETGGLKALPEGKFTPGILLAQTMSGDEFGSRMKPLKQKKADWKEVSALVEQAFGWKVSELNEEDQTALTRAWAATLDGNKETQSLYGKSDPVLVTCSRIQARLAGFQFTTGGHTKVNLPVLAMGVGAETFSGEYDNTEIPKKIRALMLGKK